jgi:hypothetical protein
MSRRRRGLLFIGIAVIAAVLAFPLRETIYQAVIIPVAFIGWALNLLYRSLSQVVWWSLTIGIVLLMLVLSLVPHFQRSRKNELKSRPRHGQVEDLAIWLARAAGGTYFKWLIANRLGKLSYQILLHRENGRPRSVFAPLVGIDWEPTKELQNYLETGLHGSFADFPYSPIPFAPPPKTPLDHDVHGAVEFLESQVENDHSPRSH